MENQLLKEATSLKKCLSVELVEPEIKRETLPLSPERRQEVLNTILSGYEGYYITKDLVAQIRQHIASHLLKQQRLIGVDIKYKFIVDVNGQIKRTEFKIEGSPIFDEEINFKLRKAVENKRKVTAIVDKKNNVIHYSWEGGNNDLTDNSTDKSNCGSCSGEYIRPNFKSKLEPNKLKSTNVRFKRLKQILHWLVSACPIEIKWKRRPEPIHPHFGLPMSEFQNLVDFWRVNASLISAEEMSSEQEARKKSRKWWQINRKK